MKTKYEKIFFSDCLSAQPPNDNEYLWKMLYWNVIVEMLASSLANIFTNTIALNKQAIHWENVRRTITLIEGFGFLEPKAITAAYLSER